MPTKTKKKPSNHKNNAAARAKRPAKARPYAAAAPESQASIKWAQPIFDAVRLNLLLGTPTRR